MKTDDEMFDIISKFVTDDEIQAVLDSEIRDKSHPLKIMLMLSCDRSRFTKWNTRMAFKTIVEKDKGWLEKIKRRLVNTTDYTDPSSALAEVRAYGDLLTAGFDVNPVATATSSRPDFRTDEFTIPIVIEVFSKELDGETAIELKEFNNDSLVPAKGGSSSLRELSVSPFGKSKNNEYSSENAISRITSIKKYEKQFNQKCINILWIDFQDESWKFNDYEAARPLFSSTTDTITSGYLWHSFYGEKGLPLFEFGSFERKATKQGRAMQHNGRFPCERKNYGKSIVDLAVISFPKYKVLFQNPNRNQILPDELWKKLASINNLDLSKSWINWPDRNLEKRIKIEKEHIRALNDIGIYGW